MQFNWSLKQLSTVLACVSMLAGNAVADESPAIASPDSAVVKLTSETFESYLKDNPLVLLEFFAPWCGHCKTLGPEYAQAADALVEKDIKLAQIDCTDNQQLCQSYGVRGYPTLKVFKGPDAEPVDYPGLRKSNAIVQYMIKQSLPAVVEVDSAEEVFASIEAADEPVIIQILPESVKESSANATFYEVSNNLREQYTFISSSDKDLISKYSVTDVPKYLVFRPNEDLTTYSELPSDLEVTAESLTSFFTVESRPYFGEINGSTFQSYISTNIPLAYYFWDSPESRASVESTINKLAKEHRGKINFVGLETSKYGMHAQNLNMKEEFPLFAIHDILNSKKYGIDQTKPLDITEIEAFVKDFLLGELQPIVKSEEIPTPEEAAEQAVVKIVGKNHDEIINDTEKTVLVKYYAPWCGHCKTLAPIYEEIAELVHNDPKGKKKFVIGNIDGTVNDIDVEITGYPTLIKYSPGEKPVVYEGPRDLEHIIDFIGFEVSEDDDDEDEVEAKEEVHDEL